MRRPPPPSRRPPSNLLSPRPSSAPRSPSLWQLLAASLRGVAQDPSTQPLSAHLAALVASEVNAALRCLPRLSAAMRLLGAMLRSLSLVIEPYLHQLMPAVLTCLLGRRLCASPLEDHWTLRQQAAGLVRIILERFRNKYADLQPRVCKTLVDALNDAKRPLSTHYGALIGLQELGPLVVHSLVVPHMPAYLAKLRAELMPADGSEGGKEGGKEGGAEPKAKRAKTGSGAAAPAASGGGAAERTARRLEAQMVYGAGLRVCGTYFYRHGALFSTSDASSGAGEGGAAAPAASRVADAAKAAIAAAGSHAGESLPAPPPAGRKGAGGASTATAGGGGAAAAAGDSLLPQIATSYDVLHAEFGPSLSPYTWHHEWRRGDAPGLLHALL